MYEPHDRRMFVRIGSLSKQRCCEPPHAVPLLHLQAGIRRAFARVVNISNTGI
jgi:hypothetical protein